jgi:hypothetical protein
MSTRILPVLSLIIIILVSAGCTQQGTVSTPVQTTVVTSVPATTLPAISGTVPEATTVTVTTCTTAPAPVKPFPTSAQPSSGYRLFQDGDYSLQYPASWQTNETTVILPEFIHTDHGCMVSSYYQTYQKLRFFYPSDGKALMYSSVVDTNTDVWPRDINGNIVYADIVNAILGDPTHCANTPAGAFTISGVSQAQVNGVSYDVTRCDFGKINSLGYADGAGTAFLVTGNHKRGVFVYYATNSSAGVWDNAGTNMFNTLALNSYF